MIDNQLTQFRLLDRQVLDTKVQAEGILYFLDSGHFLFRWQKKGIWESKFVTIEDVAASLTNTEIDTDWLGSGIIRCGRSPRGDWFVYTAAAQKRDLVIVTSAGTEKVTLPLPATVLIGIGNAYYLFAGAQYGPLNKDSKIYKAPFPNIYSNGRICWGNNHRPLAQHCHAEEVWNLFFETPFNEHLVNGKSQACEKNVNEKLLSLAGQKKYPLDDLVSENTHLYYLVSKIMDRNWRD